MPGNAAFDTDVLIVGAGPTGLMLAIQLARRRVRTVIIDRHAGPARETRALGVQARTLEIYAKIGIVERALALGKPATGADIWAGARRMARVPLGDAGEGVTPYPYILVLGQDDNERLMGERLRNWSVDVQWNTELVALEQRDDSVVASLKGPDGATRTLTAAWVAGCDGAHSAVREMSAIGFPGAPYEHVFFVADVEATGSMVRDEINVYLFRAGFHLFFPMRGTDHWRIVGIVPPALRGTSGLTFDAVRGTLQEEAGAGLAIRGCTWFSTYRIHHRSAERFRKGRCFLLGDAAHIHSPVGAQGMNTGLQDAYNLGWKLALVAQRRADAALLDSYEAERLPVARRLLNTTDRAFRLIVADNAFAGLLRTKVLARIAAFAMGRRGIQRFAFGVISQTGIHYRDGPLAPAVADLPAGAPRPGDRFPWMKLRLAASAAPEDMFDAVDDSRFALLLFGQPAPPGSSGFGDLLRVHAVPADEGNAAELARVGIPPVAFYLLRPDGYVGTCGTRLDPDVVARYATERLRFGEPDTGRVPTRSAAG